jgi:DNA-binding transcriptional LysR family regulator
MLDDLNELRTFQRILALGSLSAAARDLGVGLGVVSKRLASLERRVGQRLIHRTTRSLAPTDEGLALIPHVERALDELTAAEANFERGRDEPHGLLRVSAPVSLGRTHLVPLAARLVDRYSQLSIELKLDDRINDLAAGGIDIAVRIGSPRDSAAIHRKLADNRRILVASPSYLNRYGRPRALHELSRHWCLAYDDSRTWRLEGPGGISEDVEIRTRLRANSGDAVSDWAIAGMGIMLKSVVDVSGFLMSGQLERVLADWQSAPAPIYALVGSRRHVPRKTRLFLDAVLEHLEACEEVGRRRRGTRDRAAR